MRQGDVILYKKVAQKYSIIEWICFLHNLGSAKTHYFEMIINVCWRWNCEAAQIWAILLKRSICRRYLESKDWL
jgi:hypothetical protein